MSRPDILSSRTVLVDMDGVLADFDGEVITRLGYRHPEVRPLPLDIPGFYTANNYPAEHQEKVWAISNQAGFVEALPVIPHAVTGWERIIGAGYVPRICSTLLPEEFAPHCRQEKIAWLETHFVPVFGAWVVQTAIFTPHKHLEPAVALIDDKPAPIKGSGQASWEHIIFDRACNRTLSSRYIRLNGWDDEALPEKLHEATRRQSIS